MREINKVQKGADVNILLLSRKYEIIVHNIYVNFIELYIYHPVYAESGCGPKEDKRSPPLGAHFGKRNVGGFVFRKRRPKRPGAGPPGVQRQTQRHRDADAAPAAEGRASGSGRRSSRLSRLSARPVLQLSHLSR